MIKWKIELLFVEGLVGEPGVGQGCGLISEICKLFYGGAIGARGS